MTTRDYLSRAPNAGIRIAYASEGPEQFCDLRIPEAVGPFPVIVTVHGGWWPAATTLDYAGHLAAALTNDGFASWNIEYRRVGESGGGYPNTLRDATAALGALRETARNYPLDLRRIVVAGHSAGGHLAAWLAAKQSHRALDIFGPPLPLIGAVSVAGALDFAPATAVPVSYRDAVRDFLGGELEDVPEGYALASAMAWLPIGIPFIALHGTADLSVPLEISEHYVDRLQAVGDRAKLVVLEGVDHFEPFDPDTRAGAAVKAAIHELVTP